MSQNQEDSNTLWGNKRINFISNINKVEIKLKGLWEKIGLDNDLIEKRVDRVFAILDEVLEEMVNEENTLLQQLEVQVKIFQDKLISLAQELHIESIPFERTNNLLQDEDKLRFLINEYEKDKKMIMNEWKNLDNLQKAICRRVGVSPLITPLDGIPTDAQTKSLISFISNIETDLKAREAKFLVTKQDIIKMVREMEYPVEDEFLKNLMATNSENSMVLSNDTLNKIANVKEKLEREYQEVKKKIDRLWATVTSLWSILATSEKDIASFKEKNTKYTITVLENLIKEESSLKNARLENISVYIPRLKQELYSAWNKIRFGQEKRAQFIRVYDNNVSEESLTAHEDALVVAQEYYENNKEIFQVLEKRDECWNKFYEFETSQTKADTFNNRGGALLKEEKMRKIVIRELPRLEEELISLIHKWEDRNGISFLIDDQTLNDYISKQQWKLKEEKEQRRRARQISKTPGTTPTKVLGKNTSRMNTTLYKPRIMTETCNRTKIIDSSTLFTPVKRRSSLAWPTNTMSVPIQHTNAVQLQPSMKTNNQSYKRCLADAFSSAFKSKYKNSPFDNISPNIAVVSPIFAHNKMENKDDTNSKSQKLVNSSLNAAKENWGFGIEGIDDCF